MNLSECINLCVNNFSEFGLGDITSDGFEKELIVKYKSSIITELEKRFTRSNIYDMEFKPLKHILTPKSRYIFDYRKAAIIEPVSLMMYTVLVFQIAEEIEKHRIQILEERVFSYRWQPDGNNIFGTR